MPYTRELIKRLETNGWRELAPLRYSQEYAKRNWVCRIDFRYGVFFYRYHQEANDD
jgi:hypothetical protein